MQICGALPSLMWINLEKKDPQLDLIFLVQKLSETSFPRLCYFAMSAESQVAMEKRRWKPSRDTKLERNAALHMSKERSGTRKKYVDQCASSPGTFIPTNYQTCSYLYPCDAAVPCCSVGSSDVAESFQSICLRSLHSICSGCAQRRAAVATTY